MSIYPTLFRPKSVRTYSNAKLTLFPRLPSNSRYDQISISSPKLTSFQNYSANALPSKDNSSPQNTPKKYANDYNILDSPLSCLVYLNLENTGITSFKGACRTPTLKYLFLTNTPLSHYTHLRTMAAIVFGPTTLEAVDYVNIKKSERTYCILNADTLYDTLIEGWIITMLQPIKLYNPETRQRRLFYTKSESNSPISSFSMTSMSFLSQIPTSPSTTIVYSSTPKKTPTSVSPRKKVRTFGHDGIDFLRYLETLFYQTNLSCLVNSNSPKSNSTTLTYEETISNLNSVLSPKLKNVNEISLFVNFVLNAVNLRPLYIEYIVQIVKSVSNDKIINTIKAAIPQFHFFSYSSLSMFLELMLEQNVLTKSDIRPLFLTVYDQFESWYYPFSLFASNEKNNEDQISIPEFTVPFIDFFCDFSNLIKKVDNTLYSNLMQEATEQETAIIEAHQKNLNKRNEIIEKLLNDDYESFESSNFSDEEIKSCILNFTPWYVSDTSIKNAAFAFSSATNCLKQHLTENDDPILSIFAIAGGSADTFDLLKENDDDDIYDLLNTAIQYHRFDLFKRVYKENDDTPSLIESAIDNMEINVLHYLIRGKRAKFDESLIDKAFGSPFISNAFIIYLTALGFKSENELILAIQTESTKLVKSLLIYSKGKNDSMINHRGIDQLKWAPLHIAANLGNKSMVTELMNFPGIDVNLQDTEGNTALMISVSNNFDDVATSMLSIKGCPVDANIVDNNGWSPLHIAVGNQNAKIVKSLLMYDIDNKYGKRVDVNKKSNPEDGVKNHGEQTPLIMAAKIGNEEIFNLLIQRNDIDVNCVSTNGESALSIAVKANNLDFVKKIVGTQKVNQQISLNALKLANDLKYSQISKLLQNK